MRRRLLEDGVRLHQGGRLAQAESRYREVLTHFPDDPFALRFLGLARHGQGDARGAAEALSLAVRLTTSPGADILCEQGHALMDIGDMEGARVALEAALERDRTHARAWSLLGDTLVNLGFTEAAVATYREALAVAPENVLTWNNLATSLQFLGRDGEAHEAYLQALAIAPDFPCLYNFSRIHIFTSDEPQFQRMRSRWEGAHFAGPEQAIDLGFGLAKALDDTGNYAHAFDVLLQANAIKRQTFDYATDQMSARFEALRRWIADVVGVAGKAGGDAVDPIFIVGMPRSGSTLVEQILASHNQVAGAGELPFFPQLVTHARKALEEGVMQDMAEAARWVRTEYLRRVSSRVDTGSIFTDKLPDNFAYLGLIHALFPKARMIHVRRDPMDVILSCFQCNFTLGQPYAYDLEELADYYLEYRAMMRHWQTGLPAGRIHELDYERLVERPRETITELLEYCGLPWEEACVNFHQTARTVETASANQVRRPLYRTSVRRWRHYSEQLRVIRKRIEAGMARS